MAKPGEVAAGSGAPDPHGSPDPVEEAERKKQGELGADMEDLDRTPGDGSLQGAVPAGLTTEELRRREEDESETSGQPGSG